MSIQESTKHKEAAFRLKSKIGPNMSDPYLRLNGAISFKKSRHEIDHGLTNPYASYRRLRGVDLVEGVWMQDTVEHNNLAELDGFGQLVEVGPCYLEAPELGRQDIEKFEIRTTTPSGRNASEFQLSHSRPNMRIAEMDDATSSGGRGRRSAWFRGDPSQAYIESCGCIEIHIDLLRARLVTHIGTVGAMPCIDPTPRKGESGRLVWPVDKRPAWITSYELYCRSTRTAS